MKRSTGVKAGTAIRGRLKKALCVFFSAVLVLSCLNTSSIAFADDAGNSATVELNEYVTATLSSDKAEYTAGETATFTITVTNTGKDDYGKNANVANIQFADAALNEAVKDQLGDISIGDVKKNDGPVTKTFQVTIPDDLMTVSTTLGLKVSSGKDKNVYSKYLSIPVSVKASKEGVAIASAADAGTKLNGYGVAYDQDILKASFGLLNYNAEATGYTYSLSVIGREISGGTGVDITDQLTSSWDELLPGDSTGGMTGSGSLAGSTTGAGTVSFTFDPDSDLAKYNEFQVTLTVMDAAGNKSSKSVVLERPQVDLDSFTWKFLDDTNNSGYITKTGTTWFDDLYYDNVAADPRVPFSDAASLKAYLCTLKTEKDVREALEKYIWDMFEPHVGKAGDYGDSQLGWVKDGTSPFHHQVSVKIKTNMATYTQSENGVTYTDEYFQNLEKTAGPDLGDANTDRSYEIDLQATTNPVAMTPAVYIIMVPTHWQTFDELHATAQSGGKTDGGGILTSVNEMANLYDIKNAIRDFAYYLKAQGSNAAVAIVNTQHGGDYSMFSGGYYATNMDDLITGINGWDTFGDCEHVHWSCNSMQAAISNITTELSGWEDADGQTVDTTKITKTVVAIGGAVENKNGANGYQSCLDGTTDWDKDYDPEKDKTVWDNVDYLYGIRTVTGTTQLYQGSRPIYSWLDNNRNQTIIKGKNKYYTSIDDPNNPAYSVCTSEEAIYNKLVSIYNQSRTTRNTSTYGDVDNATISDTVTDEFDVKSVTATWTSCDGTIVTSTWTLDGGTVVDPNDPSADQISVTVKDSGTTDVSVNFGTLIGTGTVDVKINAVAKEDYMGSNNVDTNVGTPQVDWTHTHTVTKKDGTTTSTTTSYEADFAEEPSVNVPVLDMKGSGGGDSGRVGTSFDLKDYAKFDSGELLNGRYDQLNGTLTLSWVEVDASGNEIAITDDASYAPATYTVVDGTTQDTLELPSCTVKSNEVGTRNFKLKVSYVPEDATNGMIPVTGKEVSANVDLTWTDKMALSVLKVDADDPDTTLAGVGFELHTDNGDGKYDPATDQLADVYSDAACTQKITGTVLTSNVGKVLFYGMGSGTYWLKETSAAAGYQIQNDAVKLRVTADGKVYVTGTDGSEAEATVKNDVAHITIQNQKIPDIPSAGSAGRPVMWLLIGTALTLSGLLGIKKLRN